ncbi:ShlB/FhaC/HecB family hemolysin secretion/activation protein [Arhodomonas sp. KWT2]|nr:ShlB/FhaC/HecB family hemolysin secretion/activation protein [Arhodomonas sp. KWT]
MRFEARVCGLAAGLSQVAAAVLLAVPAVAGAQQAADAPEPGAIQEQLDRERRDLEAAQQPGDEGPVLDVPEMRSGKLPETGERFTLKGVRFTESTVIPEERLRAIASDYVGREVGFDDLNEMVARINRIYDERGQLTARAMIPPQRLDDGILRVTIVEGRLGSLRIEGNTYTHEDYIRSVIPVAPGEFVDVPALRQRLQTLNRLSGLRYSAGLEAGEGFGESNVRVDVREPQRWRAQVFANTNGSDSTGQYQAGTFLVVNGPRGVSDRLVVYGIGAEGLASGYLGYEMPVTDSGGRLNVSATYTRTKIVGGGFEQLDITGDSKQVSASYIGPWMNWGQTVLDWNARASWLDSGSEISGGTLSDTKLYRLGTGVVLRGVGASGARWRVSQELVVNRSDVFGEETQTYATFPGEATYAHPFTPRISGLVKGSWQYAIKDQFASPSYYQAGGQSSVRGYDRGVLSAARGGAVSAEAHWRVHPTTDLFYFVDYGFVEGRSQDFEQLRSTGAGVSAGTGTNWNASLTVGVPLRDVTQDQDSYRIHAQLSYSFGS